ncbi:MAG: (d)CMP kinase [Clostridiales bacterium]|nr:(d)CMP kinase [Clostridiales bacterium]
MRFNLAIDGPAGAGKSTIARRTAQELSFIYVDTGALYRALAVFLVDEGISPEDTEKVGEAVKSVKVSIAYENGEQQVYLNGVNVTGRLRTEEAGKMASATSAYLEVRKKLVELQQEMAENTDLVMDGRDIGTCVLPDADVKVYLTASSAVRAKRRYNELKEKGTDCDLDEIEKDIIDRDYRDMHRENSPLKQAEDAVLLDSSDMTLKEVVDAIVAMIEKKQGA